MVLKILQKLSFTKYNRNNRREIMDYGNTNASRPEGTLQFIVNNIFDLGVGGFWSPIIYVQNLPWKICIGDRFDENQESTDTSGLSVYLACVKENQIELKDISNWKCHATLFLKILSHKSGSKNFIKSFQNIYKSNESCWGFSDFIKWNYLLDPSKGFIKNDAITVEARIEADAPSGIDWISKLSQMKPLSDDLEKMMIDTEDHNVKILCKGTEITAHKFILAARSSVFKAMFRTQMKESHESQVEIKDVRVEAVKAMIHWMYTNQKFDNEDLALDLLKLAHLYEMPALVKNCLSILIKNIKKNNIVDILVMADLVDAQQMKKEAFKFIHANKSIVQTDEFKSKVSKDVFAQIFLAYDKK